MKARSTATPAGPARRVSASSTIVAPAARNASTRTFSSHDGTPESAAAVQAAAATSATRCAPSPIAMRLYVRRRFPDKRRERGLVPGASPFVHDFVARSSLCSAHEALPPRDRLRRTGGVRRGLAALAWTAGHRCQPGARPPAQVERDRERRLVGRPREPRRRHADRVGRDGVRDGRGGRRGPAARARSRERRRAVEARDRAGGRPRAPQAQHGDAVAGDGRRARVHDDRQRCAEGAGGARTGASCGRATSWPSTESSG